MKPSARLKAKVEIGGRVTLPKPVRDHLKLKSGMQVAFERSADGRIIMRLRRDGDRKNPLVWL